MGGVPLKERAIVLDEQVQLLWERLGLSEFADSKTLADIRRGNIQLPVGADYWSVVPYWRAVGASYIKARKEVQRALQHIGLEEQKRDGRTLNQFQETDEQLRDIRLSQRRCDLLIIPVRFKLKDEQFLRTPRGAFELGPVETGAIRLTRPDVQHCEFGAIGFNPYI